MRKTTSKSTWVKPEIEHGKPNQYGWVVYYPENFQLGYNVDIGYGSFIQAGSGVIIEDGVSIGGGCYIYSQNTQDQVYGLVHIKKFARIGAGCVIMPGVTIGEYATVGALSFVKHNVIAYSRVGGIPAKAI